MFGTPLIMMPRHVTRSVKSTGSPSTVNATSPKSERLKPVAVTTTSAGISVPELTFSPQGVKVSMVSVTIEAFPSRSDANRSPSLTMAMRCCQGR
jgi:hypothetical protein